VFAAVCVVLSQFGHDLMAARPASLWAGWAALAGVGAVGYGRTDPQLLSNRGDRGPLGRVLGTDLTDRTHRTPTELRRVRGLRCHELDLPF
jgi:hypothetical protein